MTLPAIPFAQLYGVGVLVAWYCSSLGTLMSVLAPPSSALIATVSLLLVRAGQQAGQALPPAAGAAAVPLCCTLPTAAPAATSTRLQVSGGMLNGVQPNYRDMAPALRGLTSISYNRWAVEVVSVQSFAHLPEWRWPATKAVMMQAGA